MPTEDTGRRSAVEGFANEHIAVGILMKRYQNVSLVDLPLSHYDIIIAIKRDDEQEDIIRAQVKTAEMSAKDCYEVVKLRVQRWDSWQVQIESTSRMSKIPTGYNKSRCSHRYA
jgi:hypothetical protein